ncbi:TRAP transporter substrate-binding protein [Aquabacter sp. CN5-332]|uniref:TRAP transporter substrate-binding protein n=1 Tax=Aquabacter sp. CN5-332 TaxID=3156608 RepID=UPI0032B4782D
MTPSRTRRGYLAASLGLAAMLAFAAPAAAQTRIILSNDNSGLGLKGKTFEVLKKELETRLGSKVQVELHHSGTLFNQKTQLQGVQLGSANLIAPGQGVFASLAPNVNVLSIPFLLSTPAAIDGALKDPKVSGTFEPELERKNVKIVAVWMNGPRDISTRSPKPVLLPTDMKGLKIRVQPAPVDIKTMQVLGANVVTIDWTEVSTAMQQGVIDAVEPTPNALVGAGLPDLIGETSKVGYRFDFYLVATGKKWWDSLPADVRAGFQEALKVATAWNWENTDKENAEAYQQLEKAGKKVYSLTPEQRAQWVAAVQPVWKEFGDNVVGPEVMARLKEIDAKAQ